MKSRLAAFVSVIAILLSAKAELTYDYQMAVKSSHINYDYLCSVISSEFTNGTETVALSDLKIAAITNLWTSEDVWEHSGFATEKILSISSEGLSFAGTSRASWICSDEDIYNDIYNVGLGIKIVPPYGHISYGFLYAAFSDIDSSESNLLANTNKFTLEKIKSLGYPRYHIVPLIREAREFWFVDPVDNTTNVIAAASLEEEGDDGPLGVELPTPKAKTGYEFQYWETESGASLQGKTYYNPPFVLGSVSTPVIVKAKWTANGYTVTLDKQSGTGGTASVSATYGVAMPSATMPTRTGYTFGGYFTAVNGGGTQYYNADGTSARTWDKTAATTLYAQWTAKSYTVTLDKQSGAGGTASVSATYGVAMPSATMPTRTGYTFGGYFTAVNGGGTQYYNADGTSARTWDKTAATTLYAQWTANSYTVTLDKQSGTGGTASVSATYGVAMPTATMPTRTGYTFAGYYDATSGGTKYYNANGTSAKAWNKTSATTLYAQWTANSYTVTLDKQSGTGGTASVSATYGVAMPTATMPTRTGYTFAGYYDATSGGTKYYNADGTSARTWNKTAATTLYARWTANSYTVTLDKQSGAGGTTSTNATYASAMPTITVPTRDGYTFGGYFTAVNGGGTKYYNANGTSAKAWDKTAATTLYAQWTANSYTVTLDKQSGSGGTASVSATYGVAMPTATMPTRTGYTFGGYFTAVNGGGTQYYKADGTSARAWDKTAATTLYAQWTANSYTVTLNKQSGTGGTASVSATYGMAMPSVETPTRTGYTFAGYYDATSSGTKYYNANGTSARAWDKTAATTLYAQWTANSYTVTFDKQSGTGGATSVTATYGVAMPSATMPMRTGYTFAGYYDATSSGTKYYNANGTSARAWDKTAATTLYAQWTANSYTVTLNKQSGSGGATSVSATYGVAMPTISAPTRTGYTFGGYFTATGGGGTQYYNANGTSVRTWDKTANTTLYAQWVANSYTVTFDATPGTVTPTSKSFTYGESYGELPEPVRTDGYIFSGWIYNSSTITATTTCSLLEDATFVANWTAPAYTITYKANDGTENSKTQNYVMNTEVTLKANTFKRTGYSFLGWALDQNAINPDYQDGESFDEKDPLMTNDLTLYAVWNEISYTLQLNANNSTGDKTSQVLTYTEEYTLPLIANLGYSKTGHHFNGWGIPSGATTPLYSDGETVSKLLSVESTRNLYAIWVANVYTVTFDANGGEIDESESTKECTYGAQYGSLPTPSRVGYDFAGWKRGTAPISETTVCNLTEDATLYASWTPIQYVIAFDANGGEGEMGAIEVYYDEEATLPESTFTAPKSLLYFAGWSETPETPETPAANIAYEDQAVVSNLVAEAGATNTLYAVWRYPDMNYALENFDLEFTIPSTHTDKVDINVEDNFVEASNDGRFSTVLDNAEGTLSFTWDTAGSGKVIIYTYNKGGVEGLIATYIPDSENYEIPFPLPTDKAKVRVFWRADSGEGKRIKVSKVKWTPGGVEPTDEDVPVISSLSVADGIKFTSDSKFNYEIWYKTDLSSTSEWQRKETIPGTGGEVGFDLIQAGEEAMFYKVKVVAK